MMAVLLPVLPLSASQNDFFKKSFTANNFKDHFAIRLAFRQYQLLPRKPYPSPEYLCGGLRVDPAGDDDLHRPVVHGHRAAGVGVAGLRGRKRSR